MKTELSLLDILIILGRKKVSLLLHFLCISLIAIGISFLFTEWYKSEVTFVPRSRRSGNNLMMGLAGNVGGEILGDIPLRPRHYSEILRSRELRETVIQEFNLIEVYEISERPNSLDLALERLASHVEIHEIEEGGLGVTDVLAVKIVVEDQDPHRAADMANFMYQQLQKRVVSFIGEDHEAVLSYLRRELARKESDLTAYRQKLKEFQQEHKVYQISSQIEALISEISAYQAKAGGLEVEIRARSRNQNPSHPSIQQLRHKRTEYLRRIERIQDEKADGFGWPLQESIQLTHTLIDLSREVETTEKIIGLIKEQILQAELRKSRDFADFFTVDRARPAQWKHRPSKALIVIVLTFVYMSVTVLLTVGRAVTREQMSKDAVFQQKVRDCKKAFFGKE
ncbi:Wzz/FepE/Etk N-terminal domain-containing protein [Chitinivibrio alkaliphilus]|uniref:Lipopolysaccharide biosynthesis protein n=1 Tax=Chitinivibrio alkaliphilus ACht1 TaxID=1313304 RepID=U7D8T0_9BACT|nr:Wzz/FepE/Etk N-terminal domain-containing protein [Chitinivibrio alkaliphilus]ERP31507.1 lipopolysaccharide biosynthesis protein [Chitinivibrio alkaliphilus ACht1]